MFCFLQVTVSIQPNPFIFYSAHTLTSTHYNSVNMRECKQSLGTWWFKKIKQLEGVGSMYLQHKILATYSLLMQEHGRGDMGQLGKRLSHMYLNFPCSSLLNTTSYTILYLQAFVLSCLNNLNSIFLSSFTSYC
jgi:hypothetical protein